MPLKLTKNDIIPILQTQRKNMSSVDQAPRLIQVVDQPERHTEREHKEQDVEQEV